jgi:hypothetical protein
VPAGRQKPVLIPSTGAHRRDHCEYVPIANNRSPTFQAGHDYFVDVLQAVTQHCCKQRGVAQLGSLLRAEQVSLKKRLAAGLRGWLAS